MRQLTRRQTEMMHLVLKGQSTQEIAASMGVAESTVSNQRMKIQQRLDARSMPQAVYHWLIQRQKAIEQERRAA